MALRQAIKFILFHPLNRDNKIDALWRYMKWQLSCRLNPYPVVHPFVGTTKLIVSKGMAGATGNIYAGLHEFEDMCFMLHVLDTNDLFVDVGANVGEYTILASGVKGARTIACEPIPQTFGHLQNNVNINHLQEKVTICNIGIGDQDSTLQFTSDLDTVNHVIPDAEQSHSPGSVQVKVKRLDDLLKDEHPTLMKIDVEGFETKVIEGAGDVLKRDSLKAIIIEINDAALRYGFDKDAVHTRLLSYGFKPYHYDPFQRALSPLATYTDGNTIYIKDRSFVEDRLSHSPKIHIRNHAI